jgi:CRISPR-associated exonuclease Cas4
VPFAEDDLLPLSALQHLLFCERQCALIHIEGVGSENRLTVEGQQLHERADSGTTETRGSVRTARALPLRSLRLGLSGRADVVEFHHGDGGEVVQVVPVEYKRGRPKRDHSDEVQLCAQALCLEEMLGLRIEGGALFYGQTRRRTDVSFTDELRRITESSAVRLHTLIGSRVTPRVKREAKCDGCSLIDWCLPDVTGGRRSAAMYTQRALDAAFCVDPEPIL